MSNRSNLDTRAAADVATSGRVADVRDSPAPEPDAVRPLSIEFIVSEEAAETWRGVIAAADLHVFHRRHVMECREVATRDERS